MEGLTLLITGIFVVMLSVLLRFFLLLRNIRKHRLRHYSPSKCQLIDRKVKTMIVMGSGGHSGEMLKLVRSLPDYYSPRIYLVSKTDELSTPKIASLEEPKSYSICKIHRSRSVHQSWLTTIFTTLVATFDSFKVYVENRPDLILCNGPGTCIPICMVAFISRLLFTKAPKVIFVESICRVRTISLSGKILYYTADQFVVQWSSLLKQYPHATYLGWIF